MNVKIADAAVLSPATLTAIFLGLGIVLVFLIFTWVKQKDTEQLTSKHAKQKSKASSTSGKPKREQAGSAKTASKKATERKDKKNEKNQHPWLLTAFKGHQSRVLDVDQSGNGRYLVSCDYETIELIETNIANIDLESRDTSSCESSTPILMKRLSRRQKKNRKRDSANSNTNPETGKRGQSSQIRRRTGQKMKQFQSEDVEVAIALLFSPKSAKCDTGYFRLIISPEVFYMHLSHYYTLSDDQLLKLGYPIPGTILHNRYRKIKALDVYAAEFVPRDSGNGSDSGNSSNSASDDSDSGSEISNIWESSEEVVMRNCCRCGTDFLLRNNVYLTTESCVYHHGRESTLNAVGGPTIWTCCSQPSTSAGCTVGPCHVWQGPDEILVDSSFFVTQPNRYPTRYMYKDLMMFGLDSEMSYTASGLEIVKITVVNYMGEIVYDHYVKPVLPIVDYNTRYSGVTEEDMLTKNPKTFKEVQQDLLILFSSQTILIGHGLENDLKRLRLVHYNIVDTSVVFRHVQGPPHKHSLRTLVKNCLKRFIQHNEKGHSSLVDAQACVELMLYRIMNDFPGKFELRP